MVRNYKPKRETPPVSDEIISVTVRAVLVEKKKIRSVSALFRIPQSTLGDNFATSTRRMHLPDRVATISEKEVPNLGTRIEGLSSRKILTNEQEDSLECYLLRSSQIHCGLTYAQLQKFANEYTVKPRLTILETWEENHIAGCSWIQIYMKRHPALSPRKLGNCSLARSSRFNRSNVTKFQANLSLVLEKYKFTGERIWNVDQTGVTSVMESPKIIARTVVKQVRQASSAEGGKLTTVCCLLTPSVEGSHP